MIAILRSRDGDRAAPTQDPPNSEKASAWAMRWEKGESGTRSRPDQLSHHGRGEVRLWTNARHPAQRAAGTIHTA